MMREITIISLLAFLQPAFGKGGLCEVETGQSNIIMDIEESRGTEISQETMPVELPIRGDPFTEVQLELSFPKGRPLFILNGRKLQLLQPLDRDKDNLSHIVFQVTCTVRGTNKKRTIPVIVRVSDVNDNAPEFINTPYEVSISELSPVGTTVFTGLKASDPDAGANGLVEYRIVPGRPATGRSTERLAVADGSQYFAINLPHQGQVTVAKALDYEKTQRYLLTIVASEPEIVLGADFEPKNIPEKNVIPLSTSNEKLSNKTKHIDDSHLNLPIKELTQPKTEISFENDTTGGKTLLDEINLHHLSFGKNQHHMPMQFDFPQNPGLFEIKKIDDKNKKKTHLFDDIETYSLDDMVDELAKALNMKIPKLPYGILDNKHEESGYRNETFAQNLSPLNETGKIDDSHLNEMFHIMNKSKEPEIVIGADFEPKNIPEKNVIPLSTSNEKLSNKTKHIDDSHLNSAIKELTQPKTEISFQNDTTVGKTLLDEKNLDQMSLGKNQQHAPIKFDFPQNPGLFEIIKKINDKNKKKTNLVDDIESYNFDDMVEKLAKALKTNDSKFPFDILDNVHEESGNRNETFGRNFFPLNHTSKIDDSQLLEMIHLMNNSKVFETFLTNYTNNEKGINKNPASSEKLATQEKSTNSKQTHELEVPKIEVQQSSNKANKLLAVNISNVPQTQPLFDVNKSHIKKEPEIVIGADFEPKNIPYKNVIPLSTSNEKLSNKTKHIDDSHLILPIKQLTQPKTFHNDTTVGKSLLDDTSLDQMSLGKNQQHVPMKFDFPQNPGLFEIKKIDDKNKKKNHLVDDIESYNFDDMVDKLAKALKSNNSTFPFDILDNVHEESGNRNETFGHNFFPLNHTSKIDDSQLLEMIHLMNNSKVFETFLKNFTTDEKGNNKNPASSEKLATQGKTIDTKQTHELERFNKPSNKTNKLLAVNISNVPQTQPIFDVNKSHINKGALHVINDDREAINQDFTKRIHHKQPKNVTNGVEDAIKHDSAKDKKPMKTMEPQIIFGLEFNDLNHTKSDAIDPLEVYKSDTSNITVARKKKLETDPIPSGVLSSPGNTTDKKKNKVMFLQSNSLTRILGNLRNQTDRARNQTSRMSSTTTLTVNVKDDDDQDPSFIYQGCVVLDGSCINPEYYASVSSGVLAGVLSIHPEKIQAVDMDSLDTPIVYSFLSGSPDNFRDFFEINPGTGVVRQIRAVDSAIAKKFTIIVKAEENSEGRRFATAKLVITVKPVDSSPPDLETSAKEGFVQENSPVGTRVLDANSKPIRLTVTDADLGPEDPKPSYVFELTTNFFDIDQESYLVVGAENLDRDPPSPGLFRFQVVAREKIGTAASSPLTLTVVLTDVNDNAPRLPMMAPIAVQAGEGHREITNVTATDNDLGDNAIISYSIYHVSNNGRNKFQIDPQSGVVASVGKLNAGEQYSITVQATDLGGKYSQTIVEVNVIPGPNTRSPVFKENTYEVTVSEGAPINSSVMTITALDPEKEPVTYSIIAGNDLRQFGINDKTGIISVRRKLDREDLTRYQLLIKAEDEGGLSSTATVNIHVSDINDKNPEFIGEPYDWKVREGLVGAHVGVVEATDADEGMNANITYSVPDEVPFTINPQTGTVMTSTSLDYEKQKEYKFVVTAKDGAMEPRLATATVTVSVVDTEDEMPIFHKPLYEATVPENTPDYFVTQVTADDPDTVKAVTYVMKQGPTELFSVDSRDGTIKTLRGLDFESEPEYDLVIGTLENNTTHKGSTTTVRIRVTDVNDIPPVFLTTTGPFTLDDNVSIGTIVTTLMATDSDGTAPGNKIRYEIVGRGKAIKYFQIDPDLGTVTVRDDLRKEQDNEYQVDVKAYDLGEPQLSSVTSITVFVRHVAVASPPIHLGFPDDSYTLQVPEDTKTGSLLKSFAVIASTSVQQIPLRCSIVQGNIEDVFFVNITGEKTCDLLLNKPLDYEKKNEYIIKLRLDSLAGYINQNKSVTTVKIQVTDVNDNVPTFVYPSYTKLFKKDKYFGAVAKDKKEVRTVLQVKAEDKDSSGLTQLEYKLEPSEMNEYFSIDPSSGSIRTRRSVDGLAPDQLPVRLTVLAVDGKEQPNTASAEVVINVIDESDWLILPIGKVAPESVSDKENQISELLSQATGKLVGVERIGPFESTPDNVTLVSDPTSTDLWIYFIDPLTEKIIPINDTSLAKTVKDEDVFANITAEVTTALGGGNLYPLHPPIKVRALRTAVVALDWEVFPYAVILIAGLILVLGTAGIVYICISWQRYKAYKERMQRMYVMPRYDPVFVEPNLKEYETQVLQMSVPMDDNDSYHDLQLDFSRKNHAFSLDNVSYITKDHGDNGGQSPTNSEAATTTRASSLGRHNNNNIHHDGTINLSYDRSDDEMGHNSSPTNENVTFREKKDYSHMGFNYLMDRSPIETTTEL